MAIYAYSQQPTNTVNASAFSAMSGSSSFSVEAAFSYGTLLALRKPSKIAVKLMLTTKKGKFFTIVDFY